MTGVGRLTVGLGGCPREIRKAVVEMNLLFICSRNRRRSATAEAIFASEAGHSALSAGTSADAEIQVSADLLEWADVVFSMERVHHRKLYQRFPRLMRGKRAIVLGVPDRYDYMDERLIALLKGKVAQHIERGSDAT